jgi:glycyl-tRNA synthetase beta chain
MPLLLEIGCEEIPARMIPGAAVDLRDLVVGILDGHGIEHGEARCWGGSRRLAVRVETVQGRQPDREELLLGPPAKVAFDADGAPTRALQGFARKQGLDAGQLAPIDTERGSYAGIRRTVEGSTLEELLDRELPGAVSAMSFPKIMRWAEGSHRWVRPVHWVVALHGDKLLAVEIFGIRAGCRSVGHRFLGPGPVDVEHPDQYVRRLEQAYVVVDPAERRARLGAALESHARELGGAVVEDAALLDEVADLVEWPGIVAGRFDRGFLELPLELLVTTLRHHQKCFSVRGDDGKLLPHFLAVANTDRDPKGHVRRGNEWVIGGRLEDARFFWREDRKQPLASRSRLLERVILHRELGSYAEKATRMGRLAEQLAGRIDLSADQVEHCRQAALLAKNDLVTGTVGEFPELQGRIGGLMLEAEGAPPEVVRGVFEHYQPMGPEDDVPSTDCGAVTALADKLDTVARFVGIGRGPSGSGDPFGLRRATSGIFRIVIERKLGLSLTDLCDLGEADGRLLSFLRERMEKFFRDRGYTPNEVRSVVLVQGGETIQGVPLKDVQLRLEAVRAVRERADFARLVELTKRIFNIVPKIAEGARARGDGWQPKPERYEEFVDPDAAGRELRERLERSGPAVERQAQAKQYGGVIDSLADFVEPVARFFDQVLVNDPERLDETHHRGEMLRRLGAMLTRYFDIRELAGQADRRS